MKITVLCENRSLNDQYGCEHGLSLWLKIGRMKIIFDTGASDLFIRNAKVSGINIADADIAVLSHGHYDHGGGLEAFLALNSKASIYLRPEALNSFLSDSEGQVREIGLDKKLITFAKFNKRLIKTSDFLQLAPGISLFSAVDGSHPRPSGNRTLMMRGPEGRIVNDDFVHEQNLAITDSGKNILIAGCAHNGILNILDRYRQLFNKYPDHVIGGFHLYNRKQDTCEDEKIINSIATTLRDNHIIAHTGHCTGVKPYEIMSELLGSGIEYICAGYSFEIG